jgi:hypothetical protein
LSERERERENGTMVGLLNGGGYPRGWKVVDEEAPAGSGRTPAIDVESIYQLHRHELRERQCSSVLVKHIKAPIHLVSVKFVKFVVAY